MSVRFWTSTVCLIEISIKYLDNRSLDKLMLPIFRCSCMCIILDYLNFRVMKFISGSYISMFTFNNLFLHIKSWKPLFTSPHLENEFCFLIIIIEILFIIVFKCYNEMHQRPSHFVFLNHRTIWGKIIRNPSPDTPNAIQSFMLSGSSNKNVIFSAII